MASKKSGDTAKGSGRIRFVLFEADGVDGNLSDIAHAISSALRSQGAVPKAIPAGSRRDTRELNEPFDIEPLEGPDGDDESEDVGDVLRESRRPSVPRKPFVRKVTVLPDVDLNSGEMPLQTFLQQKNPVSRLDRYLAIAYWFKQYRSVPEITPDHVYTSFRKMGWTSDINDMAQPFRDLKRAGKGATAKGVFVINHLGEDTVNELGRG